MEKQFPQHMTYESEFWKRYRILKAMLSHIEDQEVLLEALRHELSIPESARDMSINAVEEEISNNKAIFEDFLVDYINYGGHGLHRMDIEIEFTLIPDTPPENRVARLYIEGMAHTIPHELGHTFVENLVDMTGGEGQSFPDRMMEIYKIIEAHYDLVLGGDLDRCSLQLKEELFPCSRYHVKIHFPAQILIEEEFDRFAGSW